LKSETLAVQAAVRKELVALIDEWKAIRGDAFRGTDYGTYSCWKERTSEFIDAIFGGEERQLFEGNGTADPPTIEKSADLRIQALEALRERSASWSILLDRDGVDRAVAARRKLTPEDQIVISATPALEQLFSVGNSEQASVERRKSDDKSHALDSPHQQGGFSQGTEASDFVGGSALRQALLDEQKHGRMILDALNPNHSPSARE